MRIKVSHESPLCLLEESLTYNCYDYCLVHLLEKYPQYKTFFQRARLLNREILLDNSIFELGHAFDWKKFANSVEEIQPTYYIVPDVLEDSVTTRQNWTSFLNEYQNLPGLKIGVVQGKNWQELLDCYNFMQEQADYIAISFDYSYYLVTGEGKTNLEKFCSGRKRFISQLIDRGVWNPDKPVHLLGNSLPQEIAFYRVNNIHQIRSVDTSNPIMAGIKGLKYSGDLGLQVKPDGKLADHMTVDITPDQAELINYNVNAYKKIAWGMEW